MKGRVLVAGFATRHVAQSAYHAGYEVYAVDHFCDQDLCWYTRDRRSFEDLYELQICIDRMCSERHFDILVVTSGAENIDTMLPLFGTDPACVGKFLDKLEIQHFFEDLGLSVPPLANNSEFPCMIKPRKGAGGWRNQVISSGEEKDRWIELWPDVPYICQSIVEGLPASVSCIANGKEARAIAINRQYIRGDEGAKSYGFSGAVTPLLHSVTEEMIAVAEKAAARSGCVGSVGIDFVIGEKPWVIEINPRFQATLDTVEMATGCNLFELHINACKGLIPAKTPQPRCFAVRRILFADKDLIVKEDLKHLAPAIADIPWVGTEIEEGSAVLSAYGWGPTHKMALERLDKTITILSRYMSRW